MCGIAGIAGNNVSVAALDAMRDSQHLRGPDADSVMLLAGCGLAHNRLSIIDLSDAGIQPMRRGPFAIAFNGEIYNYRELRAELAGSFEFRTQTDTEVLLAAYEKYGASMLDKLIGMFAFAIWDERERTLFAARDRFGVKPFHFHRAPDGTLLFASEIKALHAAGVPREPNEARWASYLAHGVADGDGETFWKGVEALPAGHSLKWRGGRTMITRWYDLARRSGADFDMREDACVRDEYLALLEDSVRLRFRADVPVGINLSGGVDSSTLLGLVDRLGDAGAARVTAYTFATGDENYDELPWVEKMLARTNHDLVVARLAAEDVPELAASVARAQDEPFGGIPTLAYARLFETARADGTIVLLDGNGLDEQWAGYDYYRKLSDDGGAPVVQGATDSPLRPGALAPEFAALADEPRLPRPFPDALRNAQLRDACATKIPRAMRFNDRVSMRASVELREPFLDHRLFELALRQPESRKLHADGGNGKKMLREICALVSPPEVAFAPKRALQTPQREWLRGPLREWADGLIESALRGHAAWLEPKKVRAEWTRFLDGGSDNSFYVWQWIGLALIADAANGYAGRVAGGIN